MIDPLAEFLGACSEGILDYSYIDAVKLAGHSCPTVAGAYLMTLYCLDFLYESETAIRGNLRIDMRDPVDSGVTGVIANVISMITGAAGSGGFKGISGNFQRADLLSFNVEQPQLIRFTRLDTGQSIGADYNASMIPPDPSMGPLLSSVLQGNADAAQTKAFAELWQARVEEIMTSPELWPQMVKLS